MLLEEGIVKIHSLIDVKKQVRETRSNKGRVGVLIEREIGLKNSSKHLDFEDGELKTFCVNSELVPKETIAITMINTNKSDEDVLNNLLTKINKVLFVPYVLDGDEYSIVGYSLFDLNDNLFLIDEAESILYQWREKGCLHCQSGRNIEIRTKGNGKQKTFAWYFRKTFIKSLFRVEEKPRYTVVQLKKICRSLGYKGYSKLNKEELLELVFRS